MAHKDYLPTNTIAFLDWFENFVEQLEIYKKTLGIDDAKVTGFKNDFAFVKVLFAADNEFSNYDKLVTTFKKTMLTGTGLVPLDFPPVPGIGAHVPVLPGIVPRIRKFVGELKKNSALNDVISKALRIVGEEVTHDFDNVVPDGKLGIKNGHVFVSFTHQGTEATDIMADYGDGKGFINLGRFLKTSFLDPHLPPEGQTVSFGYKLRYVVNDQQVGDWQTGLAIAVKG